jgi:hypothetical protein
MYLNLADGVGDGGVWGQTIRATGSYVLLPLLLQLASKYMATTKSAPLVSDQGGMQKTLP